MTPDSLNTIFDILELSEETREKCRQQMDVFIVEKGIEAFLDSLSADKREQLVAMLENKDGSDKDLAALATEHLTQAELGEAQEALARGMEKGYVEFLNVLMKTASEAQKEAITKALQ